MASTKRIRLFYKAMFIVLYIIYPFRIELTARFKRYNSTTYSVIYKYSAVPL